LSEAIGIKFDDQKNVEISESVKACSELIVNRQAF